MTKITNLTANPIALRDNRGRSFTLSAKQSKLITLSRAMIPSLRGFIDRKVITVAGLDGPPVPPQLPSPAILPVVASNEGFDFETLRNKKVVRLLVMPGIGDVHWVMLKIESIARILNIGEIIVDVWNPDGRPRGMELISRLPFVSSGKYVAHSPFPDHKSSYSPNADQYLPTLTQLASLYDGKWLASPSPAHDAMLCFNGALGRGQRLDNDILPQFPVNWDYPISISATEEQFGRQYGKYVLIFVSDFAGFASWSPFFTEQHIIELLLEIQNRYQCKIILSGSIWDKELSARLTMGEDFINLVGQTDFGQLLGLMKHALAFVGFCGGNTMLSVHLKRPTIMVWNDQDPSLSNANFWTAWAPPDAASYYRPLPLTSANLVHSILSELESVLSPQRGRIAIRLSSDPLMNQRIIKTGTGIGDILWMIMKLEATGEKFHWQLSSEAPKRGHQLFEALPQTALSVSYSAAFKTADAYRDNVINRLGSWSAIRASGEKELFMLINPHFEAVPSGNLKDWLPDLRANYHPQYQTQAFVGAADKLLCDKNATYVGCYGSAYATARYWGGWQDDAWADFILTLRRRDPSVVPVIIGAQWDTDMATKLMARLDAQSVPYVKVIGENLCLVIELMRRFAYGFYFPSGLACIAGTLSVPATMWYPKHLDSMRGQWCDPALTASDTFHEIGFCSPEDMVRYIDSRGGIR